LKRKGSRAPAGGRKGPKTNGKGRRVMLVITSSGDKRRGTFVGGASVTDGFRAGESGRNQKSCRKEKSRARKKDKEEKGLKRKLSSPSS